MLQVDQYSYICTAIGFTAKKSNRWQGKRAIPRIRLSGFSGMNMLDTDHGFVSRILRLDRI